MIKLCKNCGTKWMEGDRYCRICGSAKRSLKLRDPDARMGCIYGPPPIERLHICTGCGRSWTTDLMIDRQRFCPDCGAPAPAQEDDRLGSGRASRLRDPDEGMSCIYGPPPID